MAEIPILVANEQSRKGTLGPSLGKSRTIKSISTETLRESITALSGEFTTIMEDIKDVGGFNLKKIQIQAGIDAKAGIILIGEAGIKGSVTLTFSKE